MSPRPLTLDEANDRGLSAADGAGISTFPNGTAWHDEILTHYRHPSNPLLSFVV